MPSLPPLTRCWWVLSTHLSSGIIPQCCNPSSVGFTTLSKSLFRLMFASIQTSIGVFSRQSWLKLQWQTFQPILVFLCLVPFDLPLQHTTRWHLAELENQKRVPSDHVPNCADSDFDNVCLPADLVRPV